jgi:3-dehydroquinate dehydratase-1
MKSIMMGNLELGQIPKVAGIIDCMIAAARLNALIDSGVDIFEVRVDLFNKPVDMVINYVKKIRSSVSAPFIGTIRENDFNRDERVVGYVELAKHVDCVDIELGMPEWREVVDSVAGAALIMVSEHDFKSTPDLDGLADIVKRAVAQGAEIVKIAVRARSSGDVTRLMRFTEDCETPLVTIAMGATGQISRIVAPLFGSLFSYGYLRKPIVHGQLSAVKVAGALNSYFPTRRIGARL